MRLIGLVLAAILTLAPFTVEAQQTGKTYRIGALAAGSAAAAASPIAVFKQGLSELGYVEGKNVVLEFRYAETPELYTKYADEFARLNLDVIICNSTPAVLALKRATTTIPIVTVGVSDPVQSGLIESLAKPGGNITGNAVLFPELTTKQLEMMKDEPFRVSRVLVVGNWTNPSHPPVWDSLQSPAKTLGFRLDSLDVRRPEDLEPKLAAAQRQKPDALLVLADPVIFSRFAQIADFAFTNRLPSVAHFREFVIAGGLMSYGPNFIDLVRRSTWYVDKILKGARPAELPVQQPTKFDLVNNLKTAKALGLTIPQTLLLQATQVIE